MITKWVASGLFLAVVFLTGKAFDWIVYATRKSPAIKNVSIGVFRLLVYEKKGGVGLGWLTRGLSNLFPFR